MTQHDPYRTLKALDLLREIAAKIAAGAEFSNSELGRKASGFYVETWERAKQFGPGTVISEGQLSWLISIEERLKVRRK